MYARVAPKNGVPLDFEFELDHSRWTPELRRIVKEAIYEETGILPEEQNAIFTPEPDGLRNIKRLALPHNTGQLNSAANDKPNQMNPGIFERSIIHVVKADKWTEEDVRKPENRVDIRETIQDAGVFNRTLYEELNRPRTVDASILNDFPGFRDGMMQDTALQDLLEVVPTSSTLPEVTHTELRCYNDIFDQIAEGVSKFQSRKFDSTRLHALFFSSMMMLPPFLSDEHPSLEKLSITAETTSGLRMFIKPDVDTETHKVAPQSNIIVVDELSGLPALSCDVEFRDTRKNLASLILQGVVACRQWRYILPESDKEKNMFLGLFIHDRFDVDLCLFHAHDSYNIEVFRETFLLGRRDESLRLARILFNYRDKLLDVAGKAEQDKVRELMKVISSKKIPPSLTTPERSRRRKMITHRPADTQTHPLLLSAKVKNRLCPDNASLEGTSHERLAAVKMSEPPFETIGFIKVTYEYELDVFETIRNSGSKLLLSRVILPSKVAEVSGYSIAFLPYGGDSLAYQWIEDRGSDYKLGIAWDLLMIVSHLHDLHIAHLDIKPSNVLWNTSSNSIRIIDFDHCEKLDPNGNQKVKGVRGTPGYTAPEAESEDEQEFDPFLADAFSCGQVIYEVLFGELTSDERIFVYDIAKSLKKEDVAERWSISKALEVWVDWLKERGRPPYGQEYQLV